MNEHPIAAGKSSFDLIDPNRLFSELQLRSDTVLLDLACGSGSYSLFAAKFIGAYGGIYAFDLWKEGIDHLLREIAVRQLRQIHAGVADVSGKIPLGDHSVDVCLIATVLHDLIQEKTEQGTLREVRRVLRPDGILAVVEFKKVEGPPGPPIEIRVSPEDLDGLLFPYGFGIAKKVEVGPHNYLSVFQKRNGT
ncbi:MAG: class I SAM-dependent methyltransferase [Acidobacteriota bacterium]